MSSASRTTNDLVVTPIGWVRSPRQDLTDDDWGRVTARIELADGVPSESLDGLEEFSHVEVLFVFDRVSEDAIVSGTRHPRGNAAWPRVGIFAQRGKARPNRLGSTIVAIRGREDRALVVEALDAVDGTPVVDLKPVMAEFLPREPVRQPRWSRELMSEYWSIARPEGSDRECVLCRVVRAELRVAMVVDEEEVLAFATAEPVAPGHVVVFTRRHFRNLYELPESVAGRVFAVAARLARAVRRAYEPDGTTIRQHNEPAGGQEVFHFHLHVIPRWLGDAEPYSVRPARISGDEQRAAAARVRAALAEEGSSRRC